MTPSSPRNKRKQDDTAAVVSPKSSWYWLREMFLTVTVFSMSPVFLYMNVVELRWNAVERDWNKTS